MSGIEWSTDALLITGVVELYILSISVFSALSISRRHCVFYVTLSLLQGITVQQELLPEAPDPAPNPENDQVLLTWATLFWVYTIRRAFENIKLTH